MLKDYKNSNPIDVSYAKASKALADGEKLLNDYQDLSYAMELFSKPIRDKVEKELSEEYKNNSNIGNMMLNYVSALQKMSIELSPEEFVKRCEDKNELRKYFKQENDK